MSELDRLKEENARLLRDYGLFEELAPPDVPRSTFVRWCFDAWERECAAKPIHATFAEITATVPPEELAKLPADAAANHDKYLYGDLSLTDDRQTI